MTARTKPLDGQLQIDGTPVRYCRLCGRRLRAEKSVKRRLGGRCLKRARGLPAARRRELGLHVTTETRRHGDGQGQA